MSFVWVYLAVLWWFIGARVNAIGLDVTDQDNIKYVASQLAWDLVSFYTGNNTGDVPGNLPDPYYWWQAGAFFGTLINYWAYTGDTTYNDITKQAILHQAGENDDLMPTNQTRTEGNDDQAFWAITAMMAAESNFPNPEEDQPSWLAMAQAVFNEQAARWDMDTCDGGLKWQIYSFNSGYQYKNAISNGCFFDLAARLARYTGNMTYAEWAENTWDWAEGVGLFGDKYEVYDGTSETNNCSDINHIQWTYNNGVFLHGAAHMWNLTNGAQKWQNRITGLLDAQHVFFSKNQTSKNVMYESSCEPQQACTTDSTSFKAYLGRWMGDIAKIAPFTHDTVVSRLRPSAKAAAAQCLGGDTGTYCGTSWTKGTYDGTMGVGQQMSALEVIQATLLDTVGGPLTDRTGGSSDGDSFAGTGRTSAELPGQWRPLTLKDRAGAWAATGGLGAVVIGYTIFMFF
ncbi:glycoside hydrolase family 76 protein [Aspergillus glaucus CBS 516.65]|uniref:Mannan endo-1,6-alpha-mannosidase n=1 Tax=Aspergillus glaucus CBS 516.65 TaxID=1160497 RepID=A0A1L9V7C8_ASPGL|nr:hypothetical protein ASPGLDRAFT_39625 [Aspergillus glaucus CBS 516.65]OJJ79769.1 hypothetical protein ASPGLDRAFT_39625 [Aspergillus glaucus CBS 516.65]